MDLMDFNLLNEIICDGLARVEAEKEYVCFLFLKKKNTGCIEQDQSNNNHNDASFFQANGG